MATIDTNFRADTNRSIRVFGDLTDELVSKLAPEILQLRAGGEAPITVFINSNGGWTRCADYIHGLLSVKTVRGKRPRIITVAIGNAGSAAANLLALGDYAIAYPKATIHFHGARYDEVEEVTMEAASSMAAQLERKNRATAAMLAEAGTMRLAFHYARLKGKFEEVRKSAQNSALSEIECFALRLKAHLSEGGDRIVDGALDRWRWLQQLSDKIIAKAKASGKSGIQFETSVLQRIIKYEVARNKGTDWALDADGLFQVVSDYLLLRDYDLGKHVRLTRTIFERFSHAFFDAGEIERLKGLQVKEDQDAQAKQLAMTRMQQSIKPFCYFTSSIWQRLQEAENPLSPTDAYWLGAVDEVYDTGLPSLRDVVENQSLQQPDLPKSPVRDHPPASP